jgi:hypothetical protein
MAEGSAIQLAISELEDKLKRAQKEVTDTKNAINVLLATLGQPPRYADVGEKEQNGSAIRPDQFFRKSITKAAKEYLKMKGSAATVDEIIDALKRGGCDLGRHPNRNIRISLSKNSYAFAPVSEDTFGLWEFYGGRPKKKAGAEPTEEAEPEADLSSETDEATDVDEETGEALLLSDGDIEEAATETQESST